MQLVAAQNVLLRRRRGEHDDRNVAQIRIGLDLLEQLSAVVLRQIQIEQDQVGPASIFERASSVEKVKALLAIVGDVQSVLDLVVFERFPCDQLITRVVFYQKHVDHSAFPTIRSHSDAPSRRAVRSGSGSAADSVGKVKRNRVPSVFEVSIQMAPPWCSMIFLHSANPIPVPP